MSRRVYVVTDSPRAPRSRRQWRADVRAALALLGRATDDLVTALLGLPLLSWLARRAVHAVRTHWRHVRYGAPTTHPPIESAVLHGTVTTPHEQEEPRG